MHYVWKFVRLWAWCLILLGVTGMLLNGSERGHDAADRTTRSEVVAAEATAAPTAAPTMAAAATPMPTPAIREADAARGPSIPWAPILFGTILLGAGAWEARRRWRQHTQRVAAVEADVRPILAAARRHQAQEDARRRREEEIEHARLLLADADATPAVGETAAAPTRTLPTATVEPGPTARPNAVTGTGGGAVPHPNRRRDLATAISEHLNGTPIRQKDLAERIGVSPSHGTFRRALGDLAADGRAVRTPDGWLAAEEKSL